jgi:hypothetical protein
MEAATPTIRLWHPLDVVELIWLFSRPIQQPQPFVFNSAAFQKSRAASHVLRPELLQLQRLLQQVHKSIRPTIVLSPLHGNHHHGQLTDTHRETCYKEARAPNA